MTGLLDYETVYEKPAHDHNGDMVGVRLRLKDQIPDTEREEWVRRVRDLGEHVAKQRGADYGRVWVWVFGNDMDIKGPAICVSYVGDGSQPITEFTPSHVHSMFYLGKGKEFDLGRIVERLRAGGADEERIAAVLRSISAQA